MLAVCMPAALAALSGVTSNPRMPPGLPAYRRLMLDPSLIGKPARQRRVLAPARDGKAWRQGDALWLLEAGKSIRLIARQPRAHRRDAHARLRGTS